MPERRFTEDEARRIFSAVAERQGSARAAESGLTLAEMQEAAAASGLDPALVAAVASEMSTGAVDEVPTFFGAPLAVRQRRVLPVAVDDDGWARIVSLLRREFGAPGVPTEMGRQREWTSTTGAGGAPVHVVLAPGESGATLTIEQTIAGQSKGAGWIVPGTTLPMVALAALAHLSGKTGPEIYGLPALVFLVIGATMLGLWAMWRGWARKTETRFERLADRIEIAARDAARASGGQATPALDLDALPDAPERDAGPRTRASARS